MDVKIFRLQNEDEEMDALEKRIRKWMRSNDVEIHSWKQSESCVDGIHFLTITIFYRGAE